MQRIGLTDVANAYHRPLVKGRKVWGGLVPYGQVWRGGANENTTIQFSDVASVEGRPLANGIYGLHKIPGPDEWTVIFSKAAGDWGSFAYDQKEDASPFRPSAGLRGMTLWKRSTPAVQVGLASAQSAR